MVCRFGNIDDRTAAIVARIRSVRIQVKAKTRKENWLRLNAPSANSLATLRDSGV
jgi:hypothetical protein